MCENCNKDINVEETELTDEQLSQLQSAMEGLSETDPQEEMFPVIEIGMEDYDQDEFNRGIKDASYISGFFSACKNSGMYSADIISILLNRETIDHNINTANINKEMNIEMSKNQSIQIDKTMV
jgi:hypothetical protein